MRPTPTQHITENIMVVIGNVVLYQTRSNNATRSGDVAIMTVTSPKEIVWIE